VDGIYREKSGHVDTVCPAQGKAGKIKSLQAIGVDAKMIRIHAFAVKRINATYLVEKVTRRVGMELVLGEQFPALYQPEIIFVCQHHLRNALVADGAVAGINSRRIHKDPEQHPAAVAAACVMLLLHG
jgi:hypothetical protein